MNKKILYIVIVSLVILIIGIAINIKFTKDSNKGINTKKLILDKKDIIKNNIDKSKNVRNTNLSNDDKTEIKRLEQLEEYTDTNKKIERPTDLECEMIQKENDTIRIDNINNVYQSNYLNLEQYICLEENLTMAINDIAFITHSDNLEGYYFKHKDKLLLMFNVSNIEELKALQNYFKDVGKITKCKIDEKTISKDKNQNYINMQLSLHSNMNHNYIFKLKIKLLDEKSVLIMWN